MDVHTAQTGLLRRKVATVGHPPNARKLETTGWAVMFGRSVGKKIRTALSPLVELRRTQTPKELFNDNLEPPRRKTKTAREESAAKWLQRVAPRAGLEDPVIPLDGVPFFVLIVASPEEISFEFQYQIDLTWGVGRLWLDTPADFERYAHSVVAYEAMKKAPASGMAIFAPDYGGKDPNAVGDLINEMLAKPLIETGWKRDYGVAPPTAWLGARATKRKLHDVFSGRAKGGTPAVLLTAGHGLQQDPGSPDLAATMGAILCQDYQGGPAEPNTYFTAKDLPKNPKVHGMVYFISACYGVGWPRYDTYHPAHPEISSGGPMMAALPKALLSCENGALAIFGHIDCAWASSYTANGLPRIDNFIDLFLQIMTGSLLGSATDHFNSRWAMLSAPLVDFLEQWKTQGKKQSSLARMLAHRLTARNDARNYLLHGDPAINLIV
jgi:hypothetical protein